MANFKLNIRLPIYIQDQAFDFLKVCHCFPVPEAWFASVEWPFVPLTHPRSLIFWRSSLKSISARPVLVSATLTICFCRIGKKNRHIITYILRMTNFSELVPTSSQVMYLFGVPHQIFPRASSQKKHGQSPPLPLIFAIKMTKYTSRGAQTLTSLDSFYIKARLPGGHDFNFKLEVLHWPRQEIFLRYFFSFVSKYFRPSQIPSNPLIVISFGCVSSRGCHRPTRPSRLLLKASSKRPGGGMQTCGVSRRGVVLLCCLWTHYFLYFLFVIHLSVDFSTGYKIGDYFVAWSILGANFFP